MPPGGGRSPSPGVTSPLESSSVEDAWKVAGDVAGDEFCDPVQKTYEKIVLSGKIKVLTDDSNLKVSLTS